jgi:hypothetical protein
MTRLKFLAAAARAQIITPDTTEPLLLRRRLSVHFDVVFALAFTHVVNAVNDAPGSAIHVRLPFVMVVGYSS